MNIAFQQLWSAKHLSLGQAWSHDRQRVGVGKPPRHGWHASHTRSFKCREIYRFFFFPMPSVNNRSYPFPPGPVYFVHDRCPVHQACVVQEWYQRHPQFVLLPWPCKEEDCNPTENIWGSMESTWEPGWERTPQQLTDHAQKVWKVFIPSQAWSRQTSHFRHAKKATSCRQQVRWIDRILRW